MAAECNDSVILLRCGNARPKFSQPALMVNTPMPAVRPRFCRRLRESPW